MTIATTKPVCADPAKGEFSNDGNYANDGGWKTGGTFVPRLKEQHWRRAQILQEQIRQQRESFTVWFLAAEISRYSREWR